MILYLSASLARLKIITVPKYPRSFEKQDFQSHSLVIPSFWHTTARSYNKFNQIKNTKITIDYVYLII